MKYILVVPIILLNLTPIIAQPLEPPAQDYVFRFAGHQLAIAPDNPMLEFTGDFTMMGWFYMDEIKPWATLMGTINDPWTDSPLIGYEIRVTQDSLYEFIMSNGSADSYNYVFGTKVQENEWTHLAAVLDIDTMRVYVNSVEISKEFFDGIPNPHTNRFCIGAVVNEEPGPVGDLFSGFIQQVSLWNKALSSSEINQFAQNHLLGNETELIAYWKLDESTGFTAADSGPNQLDILAYPSETRDMFPLGYLTEAIDLPYFEVTEFPGYETIYNPDFVAADAYAIDFNNDGFKDVIVAYVHDPASIPPVYAPLHALKNNGDGTFTNVTDEVLGNIEVVSPRYGRVADFNGDGRDDLYIGDIGPDVWPVPGYQNTLLIQSEDGKLQNKSFENAPDISDAVHGLDVADIDNDGDIDIVNSQQGRLDEYDVIPKVLINSGSGVFTNEIDRLPASTLLKDAICVAIGDIDKSGFPELFLYTAPYLNNSIIKYKNDSGYFNFENEGDVLDNVFYSFDDILITEMFLLDVNGDGFLDLIYSGHYIYNGAELGLFMNNKDGTFEFYPNAFQHVYSGPKDHDFYFEYLKMADFNLDGWVDVFVEGGNAGDLLFYNNGDGTFKDVSFLLTPATFGFSPASAIVDFTNDGRPDIFSISNGKIYLLENKRSYSTTEDHLPPPLSPILISPANNETVTQFPVLQWQEQTPFPHCHIQIATEIQFSDIIFERDDFTGLSTKTNTLFSDITYYWRVKGINQAGESDWSDVWSFTTDSSLITSLKNPKIDFNDIAKIYPNPSKGTFFFELNDGNNNFKIQITDVNGQVIYTKNKITKRIEEIDVSKYAKGLYFIQVRSDKYYKTKKLIIK